MTKPEQAGLRERLEQHLDELPVLPNVIASIMSLDKDAEDYFDRLLGLVETDPTFSTRILAAANSAASGSRQPITTLRSAIARIGSTGASNLVLALSVARVFVPRDDWQKSLWRHAIEVATVSRSLAEMAGDSELSPEEAYACGLLHDVGRFVLFQEAPEQLRAVDEGEWNDPQELVEMERAICGFTHAELGAMASEKWGLPEVVAHVAREHHNPLPSQPRSRLEKLTILVCIADLAMFSSAGGSAFGFREAKDDEVEKRILKRLAPVFAASVPEIRKLLEGADAESDAIVVALGLS